MVIEESRFASEGYLSAGTNSPQRSTDRRDSCVPAGRALLPRICGLGARRSAVRLLDQRRLCRAADRGNARRRDHRACRAICAERLERADPDRGCAQRRRSRRRDDLFGDRPRRTAARRQYCRRGRPACRPVPLGCPSLSNERSTVAMRFIPREVGCSSSRAAIDCWSGATSATRRRFEAASERPCYGPG